MSLIKTFPMSFINNFEINFCTTNITYFIFRCLDLKLFINKYFMLIDLYPLIMIKNGVGISFI